MVQNVGTEIRKWNMAGKTVVVTGANRGLGREITRNLARFGARVIMACRDKDHALQVRREIEAERVSGSLEVRELDLAHTQSIRRFVENLKTNHPRIDVLINNAGISLKHPERTPAGLEMTFAVNVLGPQLLTGLLADSLKAASPSRVIFVASTFAGNMDIDDLQFNRRRFNGTKAYQQSKQANRMLTREWSRRFIDDQIWFNSMNPGLMTDTDLFRQSPPGEKRFMRLLGKIMGRTIPQGADTALWLACDPAREGKTGGFYQERKKIRCKFEDPAAEGILWQKCEEIIQNLA